jgi:hypothetical protein
LDQVFVTLQIQVAIFRISLKDALPLQISSNPLADRMQQFYQFLLFRPIGALKPCSTVLGFCVNPIQRS